MPKFKPVSKGESVKVEAGLATNGKWLFRCAWLDSVPNKDNRQLRGRVLKEKLSLVARRLEGEQVEERGVPLILKAVTLSDFRATDPTEAREITGYPHGKAEAGRQAVAFQLGGQKGPKIDAEFFPALTWDPETRVLVRDPKAPIVLVKGGEIVAMFCPIQINN